MKRKNNRYEGFSSVVKAISGYVRSVPVESVGQGFKAAINYFATGEEPESLDQHSEFLYNIILDYVESFDVGKPCSTVNREKKEE